MSKTVFTLIATAVFGGVVFAQAPAILTNGTVNAADYSRTFAPGAIVSIFGTNLSASTGGAVSVPLPTTLAGTTVNVISGSSSSPASLFYVSPTQINAQLPYTIAPGPVQIQVQSAVASSASDTITVAVRAPKVFTVDFSGTGSAVATDPQSNVLTAANPVKPAETIVVYMNSLGATDQTVAAGALSPGVGSGTTAKVVDTISATMNGLPATVTFAGLTPNSVGLYQVNLSAPFIVLTGPVTLVVTVGGVASQTTVTTPYQQLGFYNTVLGGRAIAGQTTTGAAGTTSDLAFRQSDAIAWGANGLNTWDKTDTGVSAAAVSGEAFTLKSGTSTIYDNNGIEDGSLASFYNNTGGGADTTKPGLVTTFSMSNYFPLVFASDVHLAQSSTITEMIGYFDCNGSATLPFDDQNPYIKYRMNIWSNVNGAPKDTGNFVGDVFTSDTAGGTFSISTTSVSRISSSTTNAPDAICRLDYKPTTPITLAAGDYWFSHDASIRATPAVGGTSTSQSITITELRTVIDMQKTANTGKRTTVNFFGKSLFYEESWKMPIAVEVRPSAISNN